MPVGHCKECGEDVEVLLPGIYCHVPRPGIENSDLIRCAFAWTRGVVDGWYDTVAELCTKAGCVSNREAEAE
jgi:hypothetical protein